MPIRDDPADSHLLAHRSPSSARQAAERERHSDQLPSVPLQAEHQAGHVRAAAVRYDRVEDDGRDHEDLLQVVDRTCLPSGRVGL